MQILSDEYSRAGSHPEMMNLTEIREKILQKTNLNMDIYLIDENGVITHSTDISEKNLDFKKWPNFYQKITDMRRGTEFVPDEIVTGFISNSPHKKFAYQPAADHRYLLQLGTNVENDYQKDKYFLSYSDLINSIKRDSPNIVDIHRINSLFQIFYGNDSYPVGVMDPLTNETVSRIFTTFEPIEYEDLKNHTLTSYFYINNDLDDSPSSDYMNLVGKFIFSTRARDENLNHNLVVHLILGLTASLVAILIASALSRRLSTPIDRIVREIDLIAGGDHKQEISPYLHPELNRIGRCGQINGPFHPVSNEKTEESESRYRGLFISASDAILIVERDRIVDANPAALALFSFEWNELTGMNLREVCRPVWDMISGSSHKPGEDFEIVWNHGEKEENW